MTIDPTLAIVAVASFLLGSLLLPVTTSIVGNLLTPQVNKLMERLSDWKRGQSLKRLREEYDQTKFWRDHPNQFQLHILSRIAAGIPEFKDYQLRRDIRRILKFEEYEREVVARIKELEKHDVEPNKAQN
jgi:hypothetical protein